MRIVKDANGKSWGYGFIEFKHSDEAHNAYEKGNGIWIDDKRVIVDRERGWTDKNFLPRRLGDGIGKSWTNR